MDGHAFRLRERAKLPRPPFPTPLILTEVGFHEQTTLREGRRCHAWASTPSGQPDPDAPSLFQRISTCCGSTRRQPTCCATTPRDASPQNPPLPLESSNLIGVLNPGEGGKSASEIEICSSLAFLGRSDCDFSGHMQEFRRRGSKWSVVGGHGAGPFR